MPLGDMNAWMDKIASEIERSLPRNLIAGSGSWVAKLANKAFSKDMVTIAKVCLHCARRGATFRVQLDLGPRSVHRASFGRLQVLLLQSLCVRFG
jgi:hypothetical protein